VFESKISGTISQVHIVNYFFKAVIF
jgi:hypothetical protein